MSTTTTTTTISSTPPMDIRCPENHVLKAFKTVTSSFVCDICKRKELLGSKMYGCEKCNWNLCDACAQQQNKKTRVDGFHYFGVKARGFGAHVGAAYWGETLHWEKYTSEEWKENKNDIKSICPFGQLPVLIEGESVLPHSMAILRYLSKKWGKEGSTAKDFALSQMLIEEANDVRQLAYDAQFRGGNTIESWDKALAKCGAHWTVLEKLMTGSQFSSELLCGDMSLFCAINMILDSDPTSLDNHPNLKAWYNVIASNDAVKALLEETAVVIKKPETKAMTMHYFNVKAKGFHVPVAAAYWGKELHWEKYGSDDWKNNKNDIKSRCAFGQMPILIDGDFVVPQSNAILRYLGKKWGKDGSNMKDFAISNVLIEESNDLYKIMATAKYAGKDTVESWNDALSKYAPHWTNLEKVMTGTQFGTEVLCGDMALFSVVNIILDCDPKSLDNHANLKAWYDAIANTDGVKVLLEETAKTNRPYFVMPKE